MARSTKSEKIIQEQGRVNDLIGTVLRKKAAKLIIDSIAQ